VRSVLIVMLAVAPAVAQPVAHADTCDVRIVRAPEGVRAAVQHWLDGERCSVALEIRIIPTDGGLYVLSRDPLGRVHERVVPDAQAAGLLIASWAADDGIEPPVAHPAGPPVATPPAVDPEPRDVVPPSAIKVHRRMRPTPPARRRNRWASIGAGEGIRGGGIRTSFDIYTYGNWVFGANAAITTNRLTTGDYPYITNTDGNQLFLPWVDILDSRVLATAGRNFELGETWHARAALGLGVGVTSVTADAMDMSGTPDRLTTRGVVSYPTGTVSLAHDVGDEWGLEVGLDTSYFYEHINLAAQTLNRSQVELLFFAGLRHQL
jgi:hypothetical protein